MKTAYRARTGTLIGEAVEADYILVDNEKKGRAGKQFNRATQVAV
jgi:hypothetical protein